MYHTFWLSLSRITRAFVKEAYLLKALVRTSSETSLLRSPTNRRNHAIRAYLVKVRAESKCWNSQGFHSSNV